MSSKKTKKKQTREELKKIQSENERLSPIIGDLTKKQNEANQLTTQMTDDIQKFKKSVDFLSLSLSLSLAMQVPVSPK